MADITISYKGATIAEVSSSGTTTLETAGKYCEDDITIDYVKSGGTSGVEECVYTISAGYYNQDGSIHAPSSNQELYTSQIECSEGDNVLIMLRNATSVTLWNCICYWNTDGTWNSRVQLYNSGNTAFDRVVTIPNGIGKFALTYRAYGTVTSEIYKITFPS